MSEIVKNLLASSVIAAVCGGVVSLITVSQKIDQERYTRQAESGYEALVKANSLYWQSEDMMKEAKSSNDSELAKEATTRRRESEASYHIARQKIAAFGSDSVVKAMSKYYSIATPEKICENAKKARADTQIYQEIRKTLGVGGSVSDEELATVVFQCNL